MSEVRSSRPVYYTLGSNKWQDKEPVFIDRSGDTFTLEMMDIYSERVTLI